MDLDLVNLIDVTPSQVDVYNTAITEEKLRSDASEKKTDLAKRSRWVPRGWFKLFY